MVDVCLMLTFFLSLAARRDSQAVTVWNNLNTVVLSLAKMEGRAWNRAFMATSVSVTLVSSFALETDRVQDFLYMYEYQQDWNKIFIKVP